mmetsp:Transcript_3388/g.6259  ORF Transcript_3388/g.6259 Transcript_3388/m.6259 type:complete len:135 (-) Transcript_3388:450-854(-)
MAFLILKVKKVCISHVVINPMCSDRKNNMLSREVFVGERFFPEFVLFHGIVGVAERLDGDHPRVLRRHGLIGVLENKPGVLDQAAQFLRRPVHRGALPAINPPRRARSRPEQGGGVEGVPVGLYVGRRRAFVLG